jgi:hypothetical protein
LHIIKNVKVLKESITKKNLLKIGSSTKAATAKVLGGKKKIIKVTAV